MDCEVLSRYCKNCALHIPLKETNPAVYEAWKVDHEVKCNSTHESSTSSMETAAAINVFSRQNIMEMESSSFSMVENIYPKHKDREI